MHILIFPSKIWANKCTLYMPKYGNEFKSVFIKRTLSRIIEKINTYL